MCQDEVSFSVDGIISRDLLRARGTDLIVGNGLNLMYGNDISVGNCGVLSNLPCNSANPETKRVCLEI